MNNQVLCSFLWQNENSASAGASILHSAEKRGLGLPVIFIYSVDISDKPQFIEVQEQRVSKLTSSNWLHLQLAHRSIHQMSSEPTIHCLHNIVEHSTDTWRVKKDI